MANLALRLSMVHPSGLTAIAKDFARSDVPRPFVMVLIEDPDNAIAPTLTFYFDWSRHDEAHAFAAAFNACVISK